MGSLVTTRGGDARLLMVVPSPKTRSHERPYERRHSPLAPAATSPKLPLGKTPNTKLRIFNHPLLFACQFRAELIFDASAMSSNPIQHP